MTTAGKHGGAPPWRASTDPRLVARLSRHARPGLIGMGLARRIVGGVEAITGRLTLLARFPQVTERTGTDATAIVHVQPAPPPAEPALVTAVTERILQVVSSRVVERERVIERTLVERVSVPAAPSASTATVQPSMPAAAAPTPRIDSIAPAPRVDSTAPFAPGSRVRRMRMGAPLARPLPQHATATVARAAHTLTNHASPAPLSSAPPAAPVTVRPRAAALASARVDRDLPNVASASVVAPNRSAPRSPRTAVVVARHTASAAEPAAPREPIVAPRRAPAVTPGSGELLAHVAPRPATPPHAAAQPAPRPAPAVAPAPVRAAPQLPRAEAAALRRTDLPEIAAQVQHILARQATLDRARRGLRR